MLTGQGACAGTHQTNIAAQYSAFHKGFHRMCNGPVLELFRSEELELLICGSPELDFEALERSTQYDDGYTKDSQTIQRFWYALAWVRIGCYGVCG